MSSAKPAVVSSLTAIAFAVAVAGCGTVHATPATPAGAGKLASRGVIDDPRTHLPDRVACLHQNGLSVREVGTTSLQIGASATGPSVTFTPTAGTAQADQIQGLAEGAEVIGSALLYPHQGSDADLKKIENCLGQHVSG